MKAVPLYEDNKSTIKMINQGSPISPKTKHINVRYYFIKERITNGEISLEYKPTEEMLADLLTKPLQGEKFKKLRSQLCNLNV
jgi:hypothetical protein